MQKVGYMPYYGPDVAGFNPTQQAAMQANIGAAEAFGIVPQGQITPMSGMPPQQTFTGGITGYSEVPMYEQALAELKAKQPTAVQRYKDLYS